MVPFAEGLADDAATAGHVDRVQRSRTLLILAVIVAHAAVLPLMLPGTSPPGLHADEAYNIWNAHCLLQTGEDQYGARWPIFSTRAYGEYRSTLFLYILMPFIAAGGPEVAVARFGSGVLGVLAVVAIFCLGRRWFGTSVGLWAAAVRR